jgi:hypothetical protein
LDENIQDAPSDAEENLQDSLEYGEENIQLDRLSGQISEDSADDGEEIVEDSSEDDPGRKPEDDFSQIPEYFPDDGEENMQDTSVDDPEQTPEDSSVDGEENTQDASEGDSGENPGKPQDARSDAEGNLQDSLDDGEESIQDTTQRRTRGGADTKQVLEAGKAYVMYKHAHLLQTALEDAGVTVWAHGGTALGAIRARGIIPHDDDSDFEIFEKDLHTVTNMFSFMEDWNLTEGKIYSLPAWWECPGSDFPPGSSVRQYSSPPCVAMRGHLASVFKDRWKGKVYKSHIGIFIAEFLADGPGKLLAAAGHAANGSTEEKDAFVLGLRKVPFGCSWVMVPSNVRQYLVRQYGENWDSEVNCNGQAGGHPCEVQAAVKTWELHNRARPCFDPNGDSDIDLIEDRTSVYEAKPESALRGTELWSYPRALAGVLAKYFRNIV